MNSDKKLSIIAFSGDFDKLTAVFTLATGAAAVGYEVNLFFTFWGAGPKVFRQLMRQKNVATLEELVDAAKMLSIHFYACEMAMHILGLKKEDFIPEVEEVLGVASFLRLSEEGQTLFI